MDERPSTLASGNGGGDPYAPALSKLEQGNTSGKHPGGRPRNDGLKPGSPEALAADTRRVRPSRAGQSTRPSAPVAELYKPESVRVLVRVPFDIAAASTKSDVWRLDANEEAALAVPGAMALNEWFPQVSPKWAALTAFSLALLAVSGQKYVMYWEEKRAAQKQKMEELQNA